MRAEIVFGVTALLVGAVLLASPFKDDQETPTVGRAVRQTGATGRCGPTPTADLGPRFHRTPWARRDTPEGRTQGEEAQPSQATSLAVLWSNLLGENDDAADAAASAIAKRPDLHTREVYLHLLSHAGSPEPHVRQRVLWLLSRHQPGSPATLDALYSGLRDRDHGVQLIAAEELAIGGYATEEVASVLSDLVGSPYDSIQERALKIAERYSERPTLVLAALRRGLRDQWAFTVAAALAVVRTFGSGAVSLSEDVLLAIETHEDEFVFRAGVAALSAMHAGEPEALLSHGLPGRTRSRVAGIYALAAMGDAGAGCALQVKPLLLDADGCVRVAAAVYLLNRSEDATTAWLEIMDALGSKVIDVAGAGADALRSMETLPSWSLTRWARSWEVGIRV